jgi:hypothetical protein
LSLPHACSRSVKRLSIGDDLCCWTGVRYPHRAKVPGAGDRCRLGGPGSGFQLIQTEMLLARPALR